MLLSLKRFAIWLGVASLVLIAAYPFMKRVTWWPQMWLGLAFNYGALLGGAAATGGLSAAPVALYVGGIFWTLGYDTIYAHQDADDDAPGRNQVKRPLVGPAPHGRSCSSPTAWRWPCSVWRALWRRGSGRFSTSALPSALGHFVWQAWRVDTGDPADCLAKFRSNKWLGWIVFIAIAAGSVTA